jgi:hypothetical protein
MEDEALVALTHSNDEGILIERNLKLYFKLPNAQKELPSYLLLSSPIDMLSSSLYSYGVKEDDFYSIQNPFSRLPADTKVGKWFGKSGSINQEIFWNEFIRENELPPTKEWSEIKSKLDEIAKKNDDDKKEDINPKHIESLINSCDVGVLEDRLLGESSMLKIFTERTYPPANDTNLDEHLKLCAVLGMVVYLNLWTKNDSFLKKKISQDSGGNIVIVDEQPISGFLNKGENFKVVQQNLGCILLRISFEGLSGLLQNAIRLDDFHGVKEFMEGYKGFKGFYQVFKERFCYHLGQIIGMSLEETFLPSNGFPLNEFPFYLVYLLPDVLKDEEIHNIIREALDSSSEEIVQSLLPRLKRDFQETSISFDGDIETLKQQISTYLMGVSIKKISVDTLCPGIDKKP